MKIKKKQDKEEEAGKRRKCQRPMITEIQTKAFV